MADGTGIEWTDATWNPTVGCSVISPGCRAMGSPIYRGHTIKTKTGYVWNGKVAASNDGQMIKPLSWKRPRRIFVNSMSDLFHEDMPDAVIDQVFAVMALCPQHTFQVLTKRAQRMRRYFEKLARDDRVLDGLGRIHAAAAPLDSVSDEQWIRVLEGDWPLSNVWLGVSVEDQTRADERIPHLLATPAAVRFLSCEPLLGPVDLGEVMAPRFTSDDDGWTFDALTTGDYYSFRDDCGYRQSGDGPFREHRIDWVIVGGESGPGARPMDLAWARELRDECLVADIPFFMKQIDKRTPIPTSLMIREFPR